MTSLHRTRFAMIGRAAVAAFCAVIANSTAAQKWPSLYADEPTLLSVEPNSMSYVPGLLGVVGVWFRYDHDMSARCIPPPRACYAKSQLVYYRVNCANGSLAQIQRITMDLNGDVSSQSDADFNALYYMPPADSLEGGQVRSVCSAMRLWLPIPLGNSETVPALPSPMPPQ